jgi:hypothetical protein
MIEGQLNAGSGVDESPGGASESALEGSKGMLKALRGRPSVKDASVPKLFALADDGAECIEFSLPSDLKDEERSVIA